jgi:hypothetical protein
MSNYKEGQIHMVSDALEQKGEFTPDDMTLLGQATPEQLKSVRGYLRGTHEIIKRDYRGFTETALLSPDTTFFASGKGELDEDAFFQSRKGEIWVAPFFREKFGHTFRKSRASNRKYVACELKQSANDTVIQADLPKRHLSTLGDIARLIKSGDMSRDCTYVAYVEDKSGQVFAVGVDWRIGDRGWRVRCWGLDGGGLWFVGSQVLCPGNAIL